MDELHGVSAPNPGARKLYEQEYRHGLDLFQRALAEYGEASEIHKKAAFQDVMHRAMQVLNEAARALKRSDLLAKNGEMEKDLEAYEAKNKEPLQQKLLSDITTAKKMIG